MRLGGKQWFLREMYHYNSHCPGELLELLSQIVDYLKKHGIASRIRPPNSIDTSHFGYRVVVNPENNKIYAYKYKGSETRFYKYLLADPDCFDKIIHVIKSKL